MIFLAKNSPLQIIKLYHAASVGPGENLRNAYAEDKAILSTYQPLPLDEGVMRYLLHC